MKAKLAFVAAHAGQHVIRLMCRVLDVAESWFHAWRKTVAQREARARARAEKAQEIRSIFIENKARYGSPRIHAELVAQGGRISEKTVAKIMKENDIFVPKKRKRKPQTTDSRHDGPIAPNLLERNFEVAVPDRVYTADITYVRTDEGWLYLAAVKDLAIMEIIGWSMANTLHRKIVIKAMRMALDNRRPAPGLICHTDRGSQYASGQYLELLHAWKVKPSMSGKGCCLDNAPMESFFGSLKNEMVHRTRFRTRREAKAALFEYIAIYYNRQRRHSTIGYRTPEQARLDMNRAMAA